MNDRVGYVAGLRALADLLEQHDELPLPYTGTGSAINWIETDNQREFAQTFARLIPGTVKKDVREDYFDLDGRIEGLRVCAILDRDTVCTRVVKDVREVTREVPDPDALAAVPTVTITETVEDVEWVCEPLLAPRDSVTSEAGCSCGWRGTSADMDAHIEVCPLPDPAELADVTP